MRIDPNTNAASLVETEMPVKPEFDEYRWKIGQVTIPYQVDTEDLYNITLEYKVSQDQAYNVTFNLVAKQAENSNNYYLERP